MTDKVIDMTDKMTGMTDKMTDMINIMTDLTTPKTTPKTTPITTPKNGNEVGTYSVKDRIIKAIKNNKNITKEELAAEIGITKDEIKYHIKKCLMKELLVILAHLEMDIGKY